MASSSSSKPSSKIKPPRPREAVERMAPYRPPTGARLGLERFDFNENTRGCSPKVVARLREIATADFLSTYPEYEQARVKAGAFFGVGADQLLFSDGTDEGIHVLLNTYAEAGDEVVIPEPSFPMYRFYTQLAGAKPVAVAYGKPDLAFPLEGVLAAINEKTRAVLIANPNNPTGGAIGLDAVERILQSASTAAVLIDEAYFEFFGVTALDLISRYRNLFVSRTFSKTYGLAGLRMGCVFSQPENIAAMRKGQSPYSVGSLSIACMLAAIEDPEYVRDYVAEVLGARKELCAALDDLGIGYWPSEANFVLARFGDSAPKLIADLRARSILVRDRGREIPGAVRITVGDRGQTARLIEALREVLR